MYFGSKLIATQGYYNGVLTAQAVGVGQDRLGSVRFGTGSSTNDTYYPYGEEYTAGSDDADKFATYFRDSTTGLDYAQHRYYSSILGRFMSADPYGLSVHPKDPQSWNKYAYVQNDPVNFNDPTGLEASVNDVACMEAGIYDASIDCGDWSGLGGGPGLFILSAVLPQVNWQVSNGQRAYASINGRLLFGTVNWDAVFGLVPSPTNVDVLTLKELLQIILKNPALVLLALSVGELNPDDGLPPDPSRCPDAAHFNDPTKAPHQGWEWKGTGPAGSSQGNWVSPSGSESLHPDLNHKPPKDAHLDYKDPLGNWWECYPNGSIVKKKN